MSGADVPLDFWVRANDIAEEERLAYREGFRMPGEVKTSETLTDMVEAVVAVPV